MQNNPFRYRGYYFDKDLDLYYLNARYYDQVTGRFVSADEVGIIAAAPAGLTDKNLYAYCGIIHSTSAGQRKTTPHFFTYLHLP